MPAAAATAQAVTVLRSAAPAPNTLHRWVLRALALAVGAGLGVALLRLGQGGTSKPRAPGDGDAR